MNNIGKRAQRAALQQFAVRAILITGTMAQQLVVARIVEPSVYGLIGLVMLTIGFLTVFSETGVAGSIILEESVGTKELDLAWTLQVGRGLILATLVVSIAPLAATFFGQPDLVNLLRFAAIAPILTGLASPRLLQLRRELAYGRLSAIQLSSIVITIGLTIPLALMWRNAWALIIPYVVITLWTCLLSYVLAPHRPRFFFDREMISRFSRFGRWAFVNSILHYIINQGDIFVVGRLLSATSVGFYSMAYRIGNMPFSELGSIIADIAFPAFRQAKDNVQSAFIKMFALSFLITTPIGVGLGIIAPKLITLVLGPQWTDVVIPLQILCAWAIARSVSVVTGPLFNSLGRPEVQSRIAAISVVVLVASLIPLTTRWGIIGTAFALFISTTIMIPVILITVHRLIHFPWETILRAIGIPLMGAILMFTMVVSVEALVGTQLTFIDLCLNIVVGGVTYCAWIVIASKKFNYHGGDTIFEQINNRLNARRIRT